MPARRPLFHGWVIAWAAHATLFACFGTGYSFSSFFLPLQQEFSASRTSISLVFSAAAFGYYIVGGAAGLMADRLSPAPVAMAGVLTLGGGLAGASMAQSLTAAYWLYGLGLSIGVGLMYVPALSCVASWFVRHRARATGLAVAGTGVGTLCLPLIAAELISHLGWYAAIFLGSVGVFIPFVHIVPFAVDLGVSPQGAAALIGLIGAGNVVGRFFLASIGDRIGRSNALTVLTAGMGLALLLWLAARGFWTLGAFAVTFGAFAGSCIALYPAVAADSFGSRWSSSILGVLYTAVGWAAIVGPTVAAVAFDNTASYCASIVFSIICAEVSAALTWTCRNRQVRQ